MLGRSGVAARCRVLADGAGAGRAFLPDCCFPAAHEVVAGVPGVAVGLPFSDSDDLLRCPGCFQGSLDVTTGCAWPASWIRLGLVYTTSRSGRLGIGVVVVPR